MIAHCELMGDRVAILDAPPGLQRRSRSRSGGSTRPGTTPSTRPSTGRGSRSSTRSPARPCSCRRPATWPASGPAATASAACTRRRPTRSSAARSPWRLQITKGEQDLLNPIGINCIRAFPGRGHPRLGRPHALVRPGLALPQRPPAVQLRRGVDPRGHPVGRLRAERQGAVGAGQARRSTPSWSASGATARSSARTPDEAFFVKCDGETNPPRRSTPAS